MYFVALNIKCLFGFISFTIFAYNCFFMYFVALLVYNEYFLLFIFYTTCISIYLCILQHYQFMINIVFCLSFNTICISIYLCILQHYQFIMNIVFCSSFYTICITIYLYILQISQIIINIVFCLSFLYYFYQYLFTYFVALLVNNEYFFVYLFYTTFISIYL